MNALSGNAFGESETKGVGLTLSGFQGDGAWFTYCGTEKLLGGVFICGINCKI